MAVAPPQAPVANLGWLLSQASHVLNTRLAAALEDVGLTPRSFCLLATAATGEYTQTELAQSLGVDKTTTTVTLDELEAAGLAERRPSATDRRAHVVAVTKAGRRTVAKGEEIVDGVHAQVLSVLPPKEREAFTEALQQLVGDPLAQAAECSKPVRRRRT